jgi:hypothetical protein
MNESDIRGIETALGGPVPASYRQTMLQYPFPKDSFADEFMLPNQASVVIELNSEAAVPSGISRAFIVGSDGGEESYCVDAEAPESPVYVFELESGTQKVFAASWSAYLEAIRTTLSEIAADEAAEDARKARKVWWQFWK